MNEFYREEYGHDELILCGLNAIGITREDLADTMPLPGTMAMCNALAYWAMTDPIFFFSTLGILEGNGIKEGERDFSWTRARPPASMAISSARSEPTLASTATVGTAT